VEVAAQGLQKPNTARGNGSRALKYGMFQPQEEAFMGRCVLAAFLYTLSGARGRSPNDRAAFYCSPWAETPTGGQNALWLRQSGRLGVGAASPAQEVMGRGPQGWGTETPSRFAYHDFCKLL